MRILHLVAYPLWSGPVPPTAALASAQRDLGHRVWVATDPVPPKRHYEELAAPHWAESGAELLGKLQPRYRGGLLHQWRDARALRRLVKGDQVDVVHVHLSHDHALATLAGVHRRVAVVRTIHSGRSLQSRPGQAAQHRRAHGFVVRAAGHDRRLRTMVGAQVPVAVIPGSVPPDLKPPSPEKRERAREELGVTSGQTLVVQAALIADRGQRELVAALEHLGPEFRLMLAGDGEDAPGLDGHVEATGLQGRVQRVGYLNRERLVSLYHAADVAFVGRPGNDATQRGHLEALACGLPVVGVTDSFAPEAGPGVVLAESWSAEAMAAALTAAAGKPKSPQGPLEDRARAAIIGATPEREARATLELYGAARRFFSGGGR